MTAERYLEHQVKRSRTSPSHLLLPPPLDINHLPLRNAPSLFRLRLHHILHLHPPDVASSNSPLLADHPPSLGKIALDCLDVAKFASFSSPNLATLRAATIVGSSQMGKTTMLNSMLNLFGFLYPIPVFTDVRLLPTHTSDQTGLPFPLRLEYGDKYELLLQRWNPSHLEDAMCKAAANALAENADFFEDLDIGLVDITPGSFLEFVVKHRSEDESGCYFPSPSAKENLKADGSIEEQDFTSVEGHVHDALRGFLIGLVEDSTWFHYERVTLRCPSQLLKYLHTGFIDTCILDLPGIGIVDDNNCLVEELVLKHMKEAETVIILTGERSFTNDVVRVLKHSLFERLLDLSIEPMPTVAITNSRNLRGLREEEMEEWRAATLNGKLGWNTEIRAFAAETFLGRRHREFKSLEPDLFPNDLEGFLESLEGAREKGITRLAGYLLRLPEEALVASVLDVLGRARSVMEMVDRLWQADKISWQGLRSCRLKKEVKELRDDEFKRELDSELTLAAQKRIFGFETVVGSGSLEDQMHYIEGLFNEQKLKLARRFEVMKSRKGDPKQEVPKMVKDALLHIAAKWDENVGRKAFERFLTHAHQISQSLYQKWARTLFHGGGRDSRQDEKQEHACQFMISYLVAMAKSSIIEDNFKYTLTHGIRQQAWNLDFKELTKMRLRQTRSASAASIDHLWTSIQTVMRTKEAAFKECMQEHMFLKSASVQELIRLLKRIILNTFQDCERNFGSVMNVLEKIANGGLVMNDDPVIILRKELEALVKSIEKYLEHLKEERDRFGAEELEKALQACLEVNFGD